MSSLKLAFLCHEFPPIGGGAATALDHLTQNLAALGHEVLVLTIGPAGNSHPYPSLPNRKVISLGNIRKDPSCPSLFEFIRSYFLLRFKAPSYLNDFKPQVIISFLAFPAGHAILPYIKRKKIPSVVSIRGVDAPGFYENRLKGLVRFLIPSLIKPVLYASRLIYTNGQRLKDLVEHSFKSLPLINLPNGVEIPSSLNLSERSFESLNLIFVGQLIPRKRVIETLKGVMLFAKDASQNVILTFAGTGELEPELQKLAQENSPNLQVIFKGYMPRSELFSLYKKQHVMMHLSHDEGVSNTLLEGFAHGLAFVVSQNVVYERNTLENFPGKILTSFSSEEIAQNLSDLFSSPKKLEDLFQVSRQCAENFSWKTHTHRFLDHIQRIL